MSFRAVVRGFAGSMVALAAVVVAVEGPLSSSAQAQIKKIEIVVTPKSPNAEVKLGPADVKMAAMDWYAEAKADFTGSRKKYAGKVIELTGTVVRLGEDFGNTRITMQGDKSGQTFHCFTVDRRPWLKVSPGATVKVKGIVPEAGSVGDLGSVQIVNAGDYKAVSISAAKLAGEFAKDRADAAARYHQKWCNLTGEVLANKEAPNGLQVTLKGAGDIEVVCFSGTFGNKDPMASLKKGATAKVFGQLVIENNNKKQIFLTDGLLTDPRPAK